MSSNVQRHDAPMNDQVAFWNQWNTETREQNIERVSLDQRDAVCAWLDEIGRHDLEILEVGCGAGWLCQSLTAYGSVTGTDLSHQCLERASQRLPSVRFVAGDFMALKFDEARYDVIVSLEVLSHVADQKAFIAQMASLLKPGGYLMLATQNRPQLERNAIAAPKPGQIRHWVDRYQLSDLLSPDFRIRSMFSLTPKCNRGVLRALNAGKVHTTLNKLGLGAVSRAITRGQERLWFGWTLMCLAQTPASELIQTLAEVAKMAP